MAAKIFVLAIVLAACNAVPVWYTEIPGVVFRTGRSPSFSYGFGSGFSSNIGGISHSSGIGAAFNSGDGQTTAYGFGDGGPYARGVGIANAGNSYPVQYHQQPTYQVVRPYESAVASAQNFGGYNSAVSSAQTLGGFGTAVSSAQNVGPARFNSAVSSAQNGYGSAISSANSGYGSGLSSARNSGFGTSVSSAQSSGPGLGFRSSVAATENNGGYSASIAQTSQQLGGVVQHSGATSINGPGIQAANSHAINTGFY